MREAEGWDVDLRADGLLSLGILKGTLKTRLVGGSMFAGSLSVVQTVEIIMTSVVGL